MNKFQLILGAAAVGATLLTGCASQGSVDQLTARVDALATDVEALKTQQSKLANDVAFVKSDAARANERLDNLARRYKK